MTDMHFIKPYRTCISIDDAMRWDLSVIEDQAA
jgi:hypothetical protein